MAEPSYPSYSVPSFCDFFKSMYYTSTYVPPVDLSDQALSKRYNRSVKDDEIDQRIQQKIAPHQHILSEYACFSDDVNDKVQVLEQAGFQLLAIKKTVSCEERLHYTAMAHPDIPGWVIKTGAKRPHETFPMPEQTNDRNEEALTPEEDGLLRVEMSKRIAQIGGDLGIIDVIVPVKRFVAYNDTLDESLPPVKKYCVISKKLDVLSAKDTINLIRSMDDEHQSKLAKKLSVLIREIGFIDANFDNIRLTAKDTIKGRKIAFVDTEPHGLMIPKKKGLWNFLFHPKPTTVEECGRIGLDAFQKTAKYWDMGAFADTLEKEYNKIANPALSKWKIALTILSGGLLALIYCIVAYFKRKIAEKALERLEGETKKGNEMTKDKSDKVPPTPNSKGQLQIVAQDRRRFTTSIANVPFRTRKQSET